jgi:hypothetical protein
MTKEIKPGSADNRPTCRKLYIKKFRVLIPNSIRLGSRDIQVSVVTRLRSRGPRERGSIPKGRKRFLSSLNVQAFSEAHSVPISVDRKASFIGGLAVGA